MRRAEFLMLLLCCRMGRNLQPLTRTEYQRFAQQMLQAKHLFSDEPMSVQLLMHIGCTPAEAEKINALLQTEAAAQRYLSARPDIHAVTRLSPYFPAALRKLEECPAALFCLGDLALFDTPKIALVGNRRLYPRARELAARVGTEAAQKGYTLVSGGATGADQIAQEACLQAGGHVISILPNELPRSAQKNVLFCSDEGYRQSFTAARALRRNHYIHALGEKTFVAQCAHRTGGTWDGACDNLRRKLSPLFVLDDGSAAASELLEMGAIKIQDDTHPLKSN